MSRRRAASLILALTLAAVVVAATSEWGSRSPSAPFSARVVRAVDGDTLVVQEASGAQQRIRVIGVDTPEDVDPGKPVQCWSQRAAAFTKHALVGRDVLLVPGHERHDRYGRTLAYVLRSDGLELEAALLRGGYARTLAIAPNTDHAARYAGLELAARKAGRGLWGACPGALAWASGR